MNSDTPDSPDNDGQSDSGDHPLGDEGRGVDPGRENERRHDELARDDSARDDSAQDDSAQDERAQDETSAAQDSSDTTSSDSESETPQAGEPPVSEAFGDVSDEQGRSPFQSSGGAAVQEESPFKSSPFKDGADVRETSAATFSMMHVLFWTMGVGVALSMHSEVPTGPGGGSDEFGAMMRMYSQAGRFSSGIFMGPMIGMLPFWYIYRRQGISFPYHPGHWFLMHYGATFLVSVAGNWVMRATGTNLLFTGDQFDVLIPAYLSAAVSSLAGGVVAVIAYRATAHERPIWRAVIGLMAAQSILTVVCVLGAVASMLISEMAMMIGLSVMGMTTGCLSMLFYICTLVAIIMDFVEGNRRDWLHWMPFALVVAGMVVLAAVVIVGGIWLY